MLKNYFDDEIKSTLAHAFAAVLAGYLSFIVGRPEMAVVLALAVLGITVLFVQKVMKINRQPKWFLSNGVAVFLFVWFIVWTIFHTLRVWSTLG